MDEYVATLREWLEETWPPVGDHNLDVDGHPWLALELTHLGRDTWLESHVTAEGLLWAWPGKDPIVVPHRADHVDLPGDEVTGPFRVSLRYAEFSPVHESWMVVCAAQALANRDDLSASHRSKLLNAVEAAMTSRWLMYHMDAAAGSFWSGDAPPKGTCNVVLHALEARLWLDVAAGKDLECDVIGVCVAVDEALKQYGDALLVVDNTEYCEVVLGHVLDEDAWWGTQAKLDRACPASALEEMRA